MREPVDIHPLKKQLKVLFDQEGFSAGVGFTVLWIAQLAKIPSATASWAVLEKHQRIPPYALPFHMNSQLPSRQSKWQYRIKTRYRELQTTIRAFDQPELNGQKPRLIFMKPLKKTTMKPAASFTGTATL